jgi:hypothetical protein
MAFSCVLYLKAECDGCGECDRRPAFEDDECNPFEIDYYDEE